MSFNINTSTNSSNTIDNNRQEYLTPMSSPVICQGFESMSITASCEKRNFTQAFNDENEEQRYGQKISGSFFNSNIGHCVVSIDEEFKEGGKRPANTTNDSVSNNFTMDSNNKFQYKKQKETDVQEIIQWCEYYQNNRNLFNV